MKISAQKMKISAPKSVLRYGTPTDLFCDFMFSSYSCVRVRNKKIIPHPAVGAPFVSYSLSQITYSCSFS